MNAAPSTLPRAVPAMPALAAVVAALLRDWLSAELFLRRDSVSSIASAFVAKTLLLAGLAAAAQMLLPRHAFVVVLRAAAIAGCAALVLSGLRSAAGPTDPVGLATQLALLALGLWLALALALRLPDATADRLMRALLVAAVALAGVPAATRLASAPPRPWIGPAPADATPRATIFLLLDEMSHGAAAPLADDLRGAGLNVRYEPLEPAGDGSLKAMPALFTGQPFPRARPCGASTLCSDPRIADFPSSTCAGPTSTPPACSCPTATSAACARATSCRCPTSSARLGAASSCAT
jgi:hypothetical protein